MKRTLPMSIAEYRRLANRLDKRFGPDKSWNELPILHKPGRPRKGDKRESLNVHSIKTTSAEWKILKAGAKAHGTSVNTLIRWMLRPSVLPRVLKAASID